MRSLSDDFEITALSTSRRESADAAGKLFGVPLAFDKHQELVNSPAVDVVAVTVKVPRHLELATAALEAGKAVYCEWPLGNGFKEAEILAQAYARFARDYREGTHLCPTFEDAVTRHRMLDAIEAAAATGQRQTLG